MLSKTATYGLAGTTPPLLSIVNRPRVSELSVQARRVGQTKSGAKRQHIKGWEDGRKRTGPASADPV
jgi:hypothetical protein